MLQQPQQPAAGPAMPPVLAAALPKLLPYVPKLLSLLSEAPAFTFGYAVTFIYLVVWVGPTAFKTAYAPVSGFHILAFVLCGLFWRNVALGYSKYVAMRKRKEGAYSIVADLLLLSHEPKLD